MHIANFKHCTWHAGLLYFLKLIAMSMYRLYREVWVPLRFTHRGPEVRGCVNHEEIDLSDINDDVAVLLCGAKSFQLDLTTSKFHSF